jgi:hypothetical protein
VDEDLKTYLREMEDRTAVLIAGVEDRTTSRISGEIRASEERTASLMANEIGNLHTEIQNLEKRMETRFDSVDARLKLQAGLIQSGARAMARYSEFSENSEERWVALVTRVEALERKVSGENHGNVAH